MRIREVTPSPGNLFLRFVGCWGLLAQAFFETVRGQGLVERHETGRKENEKRHTYTEENRERSTEEEKKH